jgi:hypothetical protein
MSEKFSMEKWAAEVGAWNYWMLEEKVVTPEATIRFFVWEKDGEMFVSREVLSPEGARVGDEVVIARGLKSYFVAEAVAKAGAEEERAKMRAKAANIAAGVKP